MEEKLKALEGITFEKSFDSQNSPIFPFSEAKICLNLAIFKKAFSIFIIMLLIFGQY